MTAENFLLNLFKINTSFQKLNEDSDINEDFLKTMKYFIDINPAEIALDFYRDIEKNKSRVSNSIDLINKLEELIKNKYSLILSFNPDRLVGRKSDYYNSTIKRQEVSLKEASDYKNDCSTALEFGVYKFNEDSKEIEVLELKYENAKKEYELERGKYNDLIEQQNESLKADFWIYETTFDKFRNQINDIKISLLNLKELNTDFNISSEKEKDKQNVFKDDFYISIAYEVFSKAELIEPVDMIDFYNQISFLSDFNLKKLPKIDKYLAYSIFKLKDFVKSQHRDLWEEEMVKNFEINDYPKKKNVTHDVYKKDKHLLIDQIILRASKDI